LEVSLNLMKNAEGVLSFLFLGQCLQIGNHLHVLHECEDHKIETEIVQMRVFGPLFAVQVFQKEDQLTESVV